MVIFLNTVLEVKFLGQRVSKFLMCNTSSGNSVAFKESGFSHFMLILSSA